MVFLANGYFLFAQNLLFCSIIIIMLPKKLDMKWNLCLWCDFILHPIFMQEKSIDKCVKSKWYEKKKAIAFLICMLPCRTFTNFRKIMFCWNPQLSPCEFLRIKQKSISPQSIPGVHDSWVSNQTWIFWGSSLFSLSDTWFPVYKKKEKSLFKKKLKRLPGP